MVLQDPTNEYHLLIGNNALLVLQIYLSWAYFWGPDFQQKTWSLEGIVGQYTHPTPAYSIVFCKTWTTVD